VIRHISLAWTKTIHQGRFDRAFNCSIANSDSSSETKQSDLFVTWSFGYTTVEKCPMLNAGLPRYHSERTRQDDALSMAISPLYTLLLATI